MGIVLERVEVFISWSGRRALAVAEAVADWLPGVVPVVYPWLSSRDLTAGRRWSPEIVKHLRVSGHGIVVLTPENVASPWLWFEAGALAQSVDVSETQVHALYLDIDSTDLPSNPLAEFQRSEVRDLSSMLNMVQDLAAAIPADVNPSGVERAFSNAWDDFEATIDAIPDLDSEEAAKAVEAAPTFDTDEKIDEVLGLVRVLARDMADATRRSTKDFASQFERSLGLTRDGSGGFYDPEAPGVDIRVRGRRRNTAHRSVEAVLRQAPQGRDYLPGADAAGFFDEPENAVGHRLIHRTKGEGEIVDCMPSEEDNDVWFATVEWRISGKAEHVLLEGDDVVVEAPGLSEIEDEAKRP